MPVSSILNRRRFVSLGSASVVAASLPSIALTTKTVTSQDSDQPDPVDPDLVKEMVGVSHFNIDRMKEILAQETTLANALMDWGAGDFESALGAAAHTGGRDRAMLLLDHGARLDIFAATMLGWLDVIEPIVKRKPKIVNTLGPHGITLWAHAEFGGVEAREVFAFLDAVPGILKDIRMSEEERTARAGEYRLEDGSRFAIVDRFRSLYLREGDAYPTRLVTTGENRYHPINDLDAVVSFDMHDSQPTALIIERSDERVRAVR